MKKSQSLKERKFNIIIPKSSNIIPIPEKTENKNGSEIIIKTLAELPDLHLPIKKIPHPPIGSKKQKNPKVNQISLEKLKLILLQVKMSKNVQNKNQKEKINNKKIEITSPTKNSQIFKNNFQMFNNKIKTKSQNNEMLINNVNDYNINYNSENNSNINNISELNANKSNSLEVELIQNFDNLQFKNNNKDRKWYNNIEYLTEKYNELILTTENLEKTIINKYLDGTDNIISEIEEPQFLKEDIEINTINANASLRKHLSIRETTLDTSYHNSPNQADKLKGKEKGYILRIKNYRKMFRKYRTNFTIKSIKENKNNFKYNNEYNKEKNTLKRKKNEHKRKKKLPIFSKSLSKNNNQNQNNTSEKKINNNNINNSNNEYINNRNISFDKEYKDSYFTLNEIKKRYRNSSSYCKYDKNKLFKIDIEQKNPSLYIIKEANDNNNINHKDKDIYKYRKQSAKIVYDINKSKIKNKLRESTPKEKNIHSSEKFLNSFKNKNYLIKNKHNNKHNIFINNDCFSSFINNNKSSIDEYIISSDLGIGSYAKVKLGIHKITKKKYAIKIYDKNLVDDEEKKNTIKNEIFILKQLNNENENIMKLYDVITTNKYLYLILEYINGISLLEYIQRSKNKRIEENICKKIFYQIVEAILYCQNKNICHRDIKLENILIINDDIIKLIDFGFAIKCNRNEYQEFFCGTLYYMPPEIVNKKKYIPFYSDIWSLGVLLYAMLFGNFPFKSKKEEELFELINKAKLNFPDNIEISDEAKNLLFKIIVINPIKRVSLEDILNDPWFKN